MKFYHQQTYEIFDLNSIQVTEMKVSFGYVEISVDYEVKMCRFSI